MLCALQLYGVDQGGRISEGEFDAVVVGLGPSGAFCAGSLAEAGWKVGFAQTVERRFKSARTSGGNPAT